MILKLHTATKGWHHTSKSFRTKLLVSKQTSNQNLKYAKGTTTKASLKITGSLTDLVSACSNRKSGLINTETGI